MNYFIIDTSDWMDVWLCTPDWEFRLIMIIGHLLVAFSYFRNAYKSKVLLEVKMKVPGLREYFVKNRWVFIFCGICYLFGGLAYLHQDFKLGGIFTFVIFILMQRLDPLTNVFAGSFKDLYDSAIELSNQVQNINSSPIKSDIEKSEEIKASFKNINDTLDRIRDIRKS